VAGAASRAIAGFATAPLELARVRLQAAQQGGAAGSGGGSGILKQLTSSPGTSRLRRITSMWTGDNSPPPRLQNPPGATPLAAAVLTPSHRHINQRVLICAGVESDGQSWAVCCASCCAALCAVCRVGGQRLHFSS